MIEPRNVAGFAEAIASLFSDRDMMKKMGEANRETVQKFDCASVDREMKGIYKNAAM